MAPKKEAELWPSTNCDRACIRRVSIWRWPGALDAAAAVIDH